MAMTMRTKETKGLQVSHEIADGDDNENYKAKGLQVSRGIVDENTGKSCNM